MNRLLCSRLTRAVAALALAPLMLPAQGAFDRTKPPALAPNPPLTVPTIKTARLDNGAAIKVVEHRELPFEPYLFVKVRKSFG